MADLKKLDGSQIAGEVHPPVPFESPVALSTETPPTIEYAQPQAPEAPRDDLIGQILADKYQIHYLLGQGGVGAVYYATQIGLDRPVAIKVLRSDIVCDLVAVERFRREARAAAKLHHPNVVAVYDFGMLPEVCAFIAMEYLPGRNLREEIRRYPTGLNLSKAVSIFNQICAGVHAAHEEGIIHRDLKPQNIVLEPVTGGSFRAKVLDFGIAKMLEFPNEGGQDLTGSMLIGTPHYSSPEQCMGEPLDPRSDIYSLAVVLFQMLTGNLPFDGNTPSALVVQHVTAPPRSPRNFRPDLPEAVQRVIFKGLEKRREDRPTTALDFAAMVESALRDQSTFVTTKTELFKFETVETNQEATHEAGFTTQPSTGGDHRTELPTLVQPALTAEKIESPAPSISTRTSAFPADMVLGKRRLAVLPFRNLARAAEIDFLSFSLADAIIMQLAYVKSLIVRPSSSVERFREQVNLTDVVQALDVDTVLTGSFLRSKETLRVNVQLVDTGSNEILWREQFDLPFDDLLELQDRISKKVVEGLKITISSSELELLHRDVPRNAAGYEFYLRAKNCGFDIHEIETAIGLLKHSLEIDPTYAPAWAELSHRHLHLAVEGFGGQVHLDECEQAARKALEINPDLPEAHSMLMGAYAETGRVEEALRACFQLLEIAPNNELTHLGLGHVYEFSGMLDHALRAYQRSLQINPKLSAPYTHIAAVLCQRGEYQRALEFLTRKECTDAHCKTRAYLLGLLAMRRGEQAEALQQFSLSEQWSPKSLWGRLSLALRLKLAGDVVASRVVLDQIRATVISGDGCFYLAHLYMDEDGIPIALGLLEKSVELGYCNVDGLEHDPVLIPLHTQERYQTLLEHARVKKQSFMTCLNELQRFEEPQLRNETFQN